MASIPPKVTIAIPVYNGADFVAEAIESALNQTYKSIEVIVINDGSTDDGRTDKVVRGFEPHIRYIKKSNGGVSSALNHAIRCMTGELFAWLSHDDVHEPQKTEDQVSYYQSIGSKDFCLFSDFIWIDTDGHIIGEQKYDHSLLKLQPKRALYECMINGCTTLIPRTVFSKIGVFDELLQFTQDYWQWWAIEKQVSFIHMPYSLARIRRHPGQGSKGVKALSESEIFWNNILTETTIVERSNIAGSSERFYNQMGHFLLERSPNIQSAQKAFALAIDSRSLIRVSAVLMVRSPNSTEDIIRTIQSIVDQREFLEELIIISSSDMLGKVKFILDDVLQDKSAQIRVSSVQGINWSDGLVLAKAEYIALIEAPDVWLPGKVKIQSENMSQTGLFVSHTSYHCLRDSPVTKLLNTGTFEGYIYPEIIGFPYIAISTLMIHRSIVAGGWKFDEGEHCSFVELAMRFPVSGIEDAYAQIRNSIDADRKKSLLYFCSDRQHASHLRHIKRLADFCLVKSDDIVTMGV